MFTFRLGRDKIHGCKKTQLSYSEIKKKTAVYKYSFIMHIMYVFTENPQEKIAATFSGGTSGRIASWLGEMTSPVGKSSLR